MYVLYRVLICCNSIKSVALMKIQYFNSLEEIEAATAAVEEGSGLQT